jgi:hypothetical protein
MRRRASWVNRVSISGGMGARADASAQSTNGMVMSSDAIDARVGWSALGKQLCALIIPGVRERIRWNISRASK